MGYNYDVLPIKIRFYKADTMDFPIMRYVIK